MRCSALVFAIVAAMSSVSWAAERPSQQVLADMGLDGLAVMTDSEGMAVRGLGYSGTGAFGWGFAAVAGYGGSAGSTNGYSAKGPHKSYGANSSVAGIEITQSGGYGGCGHCGKGSGGSSKGIVAFSGGSSYGGRK
jgi:hypothetical protein